MCAAFTNEQNNVTISWHRFDINQLLASVKIWEPWVIDSIILNCVSQDNTEQWALLCMLCSIQNSISRTLWIIYKQTDIKKICLVRFNVQHLNLGINCACDFRKWERMEREEKYIEEKRSAQRPNMSQYK